ncbi:unnamed protein product [Prunus brigantina]
MEIAVRSLELPTNMVGRRRLLLSILLEAGRIGCKRIDINKLLAGKQVSRAYNKRVENKSFEEGEISEGSSPLGTHIAGYENGHHMGRPFHNQSDPWNGGIRVTG